MAKDLLLVLVDDRKTKAIILWVLRVRCSNKHRKVFEKKPMSDTGFVQRLVLFI